MSQPLVSVVMVACNVDRFLGEAIESILGQTFREFEFIIVDFGSTDNTKSIISKYVAGDNRVKFHEIPHCGLAEARNAACSLAQTKYIAVMDADDVSVPNRLAWEADFLEKHPEVGVLGGAVEWIDATGRALISWGNPLGDSEIQSALLECCPLWQPTVLMRRDAFVAVGGYRPPFASAEDYDMWLRMAERFQIANLKQVVVKYRIHPFQLSMRKQTQQTLGVLAARVAASSRRNGIPDPLDSVREITPEGLVALGVTQAEQQRELFSERGRWIHNMCMAGEYPVAFEATLEMLRSKSDYIEPRQVADLRLLLARLYWKQGRVCRSCVSIARALLLRPVMVGRPIKTLLRHAHLLNSRQLTPSWKGK